MTAHAPAAQGVATPPPPNLTFSHFGIAVRDMPKMVEFYSSVLGFIESDRGHAAGGQLVFLTRDPMEHHQIVLASGRPDGIPPNTDSAFFGALIHHISFRMGTLSDLRDISDRLQAGGATNVHPVTHGIMWAVYANDPEGNLIEFYVMTDWYIDQPFIKPLDFAQTDDEIRASTRELCEVSSGYEPLEQWRAKLAARITPFVEPPR